MTDQPPPVTSPDPGMEHQRTPAEWTAFIISSLIVLTVVGLVIYDIFVIGTSPPIIEVVPELGEVRVEEGNYYLPVTLTNQGASTAEDVTVNFSLETSHGNPESAGFTVRFLAPGESDAGVLIFKQDPREGNLSHSISYVQP